MEIHGTENRTVLNKLRQCNQYVEDYYEVIDDKVKGIFVVNQERLMPYPEEREKRLFFEPRHVEYSIKQNICIIPTPVLFELVNSFLRGNKKARRSLEKKWSSVRVFSPSSNYDVIWSFAGTFSLNFSS